MRLIPVIDVMEGVVVRGVGGRRREYRPIQSQLTTSTDPIEIGEVLINRYHPQEIYLADLDGILGSPPAFDLYRRLPKGSTYWIDAGIHSPRQAKQVIDLGHRLIAGLESLSSPLVLSEIVKAVGPEQVIFSLDLREGVPLSDWGTPLEIVAQAESAGVKQIIVLDLARLGIGEGPGTLPLCKEIASLYPEMEVIAAGGVNSHTEMEALSAWGVKGVLVASALHDGRIA
jgi:phosphoribosylformimino-5-aminoimidazole carboxamide ribotide isomerase